MGLLSPEIVQEASMTSGRVQQYDHAVLPSISPVMTLACTVVSMLVCTMGASLRMSLTKFQIYVQQNDALFMTKGASTPPILSSDSDKAIGKHVG